MIKGLFKEKEFAKCCWNCKYWHYYFENNNKVLCICSLHNGENDPQADGSEVCKDFEFKEENPRLIMDVLEDLY